nr:NAD(P)-binding protein [Ensifer adhaerens]
MTRSRIIIVGGSLGGLFAATLLHRAGFDVTVYERSTRRRFRSLSGNSHRPAQEHLPQRNDCAPSYSSTNHSYRRCRSLIGAGEAAGCNRCAMRLDPIHTAFQASEKPNGASVRR